VSKVMPVILLALLGAFLMGATSSHTLQAEEGPDETFENIDADQLADALDARRKPSLSTKLSDVEHAIALDEDGSILYGTPLVPSEVRELQDRGDFVEAVHRDIVSTLSTLPQFAGVHFDFSQDGGQAVVHLVEPTVVQLEELPKILPPASGDYKVVVQSAMHSLDDLKAALRETWTEWGSVFPDIDLHEVAIDTSRNGLTAYIDA
jgi:hypothetical protein